MDLKQRPERVTFPCCFAPSSTSRRWARASAAGYLTKPVSQEALLAALAQWQ